MGEPGGVLLGRLGIHCCGPEGGEGAEAIRKLSLRSKHSAIAEMAGKGRRYSLRVYKKSCVGIGAGLRALKIQGEGLRRRRA